MYFHSPGGSSCIRFPIDNRLRCVFTSTLTLAVEGIIYAPGWSLQNLI